MDILRHFFPPRKWSGQNKTKQNKKRLVVLHMEIWKDLFQTKSGPTRRMVFLHGIYHSESGLKSQLVILHGKYGRNCFKETGPFTWDYGGAGFSECGLKRRLVVLHGNIYERKGFY